MKFTQFTITLLIVVFTAMTNITFANAVSIKNLTSISQDSKCKTEQKGATCYTAVLPETEGSSQSVTINVQSWQATGEKLNPYPLVWLAGGPGTTNLNPPMPDWVWEHFDVLAIGYRGTDGTPRLDCPALRKQIKKEGKNKHDTFLSQTTLDRLAEKVTYCQNKWEAQGVNTQAYGIYEVVADIEAVRLALGFDKINLLSASYGTRIAWYYDQLNPGKVDRSLIMSGNPDGGFFFDPRLLDQQILQLEASCQADERCKAQLPNLHSSMAQVLTNLPKKSWGVTLDADQIRLVTFMMLYNHQSIPMVIDAYSKALKGNYSGLVAMQKYPNPFAGEGMVWGTFLSAGSIDLGNNSQFENILQTAETTTTLIAPMSELLYKGITKGWKARSYQPLQNHMSDTPTLILGSQFDVATPIERVEQFWMPFLTNGALLDVEGAGHAPDHFGVAGEPLNQHVMNFLSTGVAHTDEHLGAPMSFETGFSLAWVTYGFWGIVSGVAVSAVIVLFIML